ncbi:hypothetical protein SGPA1_40052 [Streptomyces misionensis JCM 4497]
MVKRPEAMPTWRSPSQQQRANASRVAPGTIRKTERGALLCHHLLADARCHLALARAAPDRRGGVCGPGPTVR